MKERRVRHQKTRGGKNRRETQSVASRRDNTDRQDMAAESKRTQTHRHSLRFNLHISNTQIHTLHTFHLAAYSHTCPSGMLSHLADDQSEK